MRGRLWDLTTRTNGAANGKREVEKGGADKNGKTEVRAKIQHGNVTEDRVRYDNG